MGEHGYFFHGHSLWATQLWVPLVIVAPGIPAGLRVSANVSLRDLPATILDLVGVSLAEGMAGASLARHWSGASPTAPDTIVAEVRKLPAGGARFPAGAGDMSSRLVESIHTIRHSSGSVEMFDLSADPYEKQDLRARVFRPPASPP
jgi:arylsulfatase A-like enzyme